MAAAGDAAAAAAAAAVPDPVAYFACTTCNFKGYQSAAWIQNHIVVCAETRRRADLAIQLRGAQQDAARHQIDRSKVRGKAKAEVKAAKRKAKAGSKKKASAKAEARKKKGSKASRGNRSNSRRY
jgi:hypothetical protein